MYLLFFFYFFFFKQKTAYEIRPCDWSSDVCSSDLERRAPAARGRAPQRRGGGRGARGGDGGHPAPRGPRSRSALVRGRRRGRHGRRVVAMSSLPSPTRARPRLVRSLLRLFTVQGSWNYERMQGIGIGVAEEALL